MKRRTYNNLIQAIERSEQPSLYYWNRYKSVVFVLIGLVILIGLVWLEYQREMPDISG